MKKIVLCIILIGAIFILASCENNITELESERYALIIKPDGSLLEGKCTNMMRYSDNWIYLKIDGIDYFLDTWRVMLWKK